ncbi:peptidoglycan-recognition protein LB [Patella vulgata]|uniref:peptidoglycan-recognition protein LB n=1 Tax=Patella vulgata TaxID=6465 RepID=UPI00217F943E|nr:peptidoglycan-recognition protein LB [Patella vulgata]
MILVVVISALCVGISVGENCACATGDVHARDGAGTTHSVLGTLTKSHCVAYKGNQVAAGGLQWAHVTYNGQDAWIASNWLTFQPCTLTSKCACATGNVHVRSGAGTSHGILGTMAIGSCLPFKGDRSTVGGLSWAHVDYDHADGWVASNWLAFKDSCSTTGTGSHTGSTSVQQLPGCPHIVSRAEWGARAPKHPDQPLPHVPQNVYIHHGASAACTTKTRCTAIVKQYQNYHMDGHGWPDLGYTFVIGEDGNVYEGHGWGKIGTHTLHHNSDGLGFCVIGDFTSRVPNAAAINAVKQLIDCGVKNGKITSDYIIKGHRDVRATACPGQKFYDLIQTWPHYKAH